MQKVRVNRKKEILDYVVIIIATILLTQLFKMFVLEGTVVSGDSMYPTLSNKDTLVMNKLPYKLHIKNYGKNDIVVFKSPTRDALFVKRIIGMPGDNIKILKGEVYINDEIIYENYLPQGTKTESYSNLTEFDIQQDEVFVLGDNREVSNDSRTFGPIKKDTIVGKVDCRIKPIKQFRTFNDTNQIK